MRDFATAGNPLRCSTIPKLVRCNLSVVLSLIDGGDASGKAADTGSAVHMAARVWHSHGKDTRAALGAMGLAISEYPLADLDAAAEQFRAYAEDRRNVNAEVVLVEQEIRFALAPGEEDPTQEEIVIAGTLDQVRRTKHGALEVWDIKTGSPEGPDMVSAAALQLAAYQYGASKHLGEPVRFAGIIRTKDYLKRKTGQVFWPAPWSYADLETLLYSVRLAVADVRAGRVKASPGEEACKWCMGLGACLPRCDELKRA